MTTQPQGATWSPDGSKIAFFDVDAMWRESNVSVIDVAMGKPLNSRLLERQPGTPTWSADGKTVALAMVAPYSKRFREGTNQVLTMHRRGRLVQMVRCRSPTLSIDSRGECGPVWSPDGTKMAVIYEGVLAVWPVSVRRTAGTSRQVTTESAHAPSWFGDSKRILYQALGNQLKSVDIETGEVKTIPVDLKYTPDAEGPGIVIHAAHLVDGDSPTGAQRRGYRG